MTVVARFKGQQGSLGYVCGKVYILTIHNNYIKRADGTGVCPYSSLEAFFENWTVVETN